MVKATFTLDEETIEQLERAARLLQRPKSQVVRDAISDYADRLGRLSESEWRAMLDAFDRLVPAIPKKPDHEVDAELDEIRRSRRRGGRRTKT